MVIPVKDWSIAARLWRVRRHQSRPIVPDTSYYVKPTMKGQNSEKKFGVVSNFILGKKFQSGWGPVSSVVPCWAANWWVLGLIPVRDWVRGTWVGQMFRSSSHHCFDGFMSIRQFLVWKLHKTLPFIGHKMWQLNSCVHPCKLLKLNLEYL